jgi:hypothetical protein
MLENNEIIASIYAVLDRGNLANISSEQEEALIVSTWPEMKPFNAVLI